MEAIFHTLKLVSRSRGVAVRHSQMRHRVQGRTPHQHLRRLPSELPRADAVTEDCLHSKHLRLGQTPSVVAAFSLPRLAPDLPDPSQIRITNQPLLLAIAVLPNPGISARRNRRLRLALADRFIAVAPVIGAIAADLFKFLFDLVKQVCQYLAIGNIIRRHDRRHDFARRFIRAEMQFAPGAAFRVAVLTDFPFAFAKDFHARRINHHVQRFVLLAARQSHFQRRTAAAQLAVADDRQIQAEQLHKRTHQALGGAQGQMIDLFERRHAQDGRVGVGARMAGLTGFIGVAPSRDDVITDPEREASALDERRVILFPVTDAVDFARSLFLHTIKLPRVCRSVLRNKADWN